MFTTTKIHYTEKRKCKFCMFLFFVLLSWITFAQSDQKTVADSLAAAGKEEIKNRNFDKALDFVNQSISIYQEIHDDKAIGDSYNQIATIYYYQGKPYKALTNFEKSASYFKKADFKKGLASATNNVGAIYYVLGNYSRALDHYKIAVQIHEELNNEAQVAGTTQNIGNIYSILNEFNEAKRYFDIAEKIYRKFDNEKALSLVLSSLGYIYLQEKNYTKALQNFEVSLDLAIKNKTAQTQAQVLYNLGKLYEEQEDYKTAINYYNQSLEVATASKSNSSESSALIALGTISLKIGKKANAVTNCAKGLKLAEKINSVSSQEDACKCLYDAYKASNNPAKALLYNEQMYLLRDSLNLKQTSDKILNMEFEKEMILDSIANVEKERILKLQHQEEVAKKEKQRNIFIIAVCFAIIIVLAIFSRLNYVRKSKARLQVEKDRSEHLLHNILPEEVADELKEKGYVDAQDFDTASVLFTDFKSFTETASHLTPQELVEEINIYFKSFDAIIEHYQIEKIKTIGDAYMAAGGLPKPDANAVKKTILAALDMQQFVTKRKQAHKLQNRPAFDMRVGIHVGPIVAGIVGVKKFQYDVWGDTVNIASRMESNGAIGKVNISSNTYALVKDDPDFIFEYRGKITAKGKGELEMYFVAYAQTPEPTNTVNTPTLQQIDSMSV